MKRKIKVLDYEISITDKDTGAWGEVALGISCLSRQEIRLSEGLEGEILNTTIIHELLHIIAEIQGVQLGEQDVCGLTAGLYSLLKNNRKVIEELSQ